MKTTFCFADALEGRKPHMMQWAREDFKRTENRQSCGIIKTKEKQKRSEAVTL